MKLGAQWEQNCRHFKISVNLPPAVELEMLKAAERVNVAYIYGRDASMAFDLLPSNMKRVKQSWIFLNACLFYSLSHQWSTRSLKQYNYSITCSMYYIKQSDFNVCFQSRIYEPKEGTLDSLECFHSREYLNALISFPESHDIEELEDFGLVDDAAPFSGLASYVRFLAGSIDSVQKALEDGFRYVINWDGGRHHAQSTSASGYCFVNGSTKEIQKLFVSLV